MSSAHTEPNVGAPLVSDTKPSTPAFFSLLEQLRALAALAVVWCHLVGYALEALGRTWLPHDLVSRFVEKPLEIVNYFGWFGVAVFFFISGFVITNAASRERSREFIVKRLLRIYPPLVGAVTLALLLSAVSGNPIKGSVTDSVSVLDYVSNITLVNHFVGPRALILAVAWTLAVEMFFYVAMWITRPLLARAPWAVSPLILAAVLVLVLLQPLSSWLALPALTAAFVPLLVLGQLCYLIVSKSVRPWIALLGMVAAWGIYILATERLYPEELVPGNSYPENALLAFLLFVAALFAEGRIRPSRVLGVVAKRSYSLYLVHGPLGLTIIGAIANNTPLPFTVILGIALVAVAAATELSYRFIERPSIRLGKRLFSRNPTTLEGQRS